MMLINVTKDELISLVREAVREQQSPVNSGGQQSKIVTDGELCQYLNVTPPTLLKMRSKGKIPFMQIGSSIRYDLYRVIEALEKSKLG